MGTSNAMALAKAKRYSLRKCGQGNVCACKAAKMVMAAQSINIMASSMAMMVGANADEKHPNKLPFSGVLLVLDKPSTKPPHGSRGHRIYVPKRVAEQHLDSLVGMAVNYDNDDLDSHVTRHKVGIITKAWIVGDQVRVKGFIWKKDFPEAEKQLSGRKDLGMSMELANVFVREEHEDVWHLEKFDFTGATILRKNAAAYFNTELSAMSDRNATVLTGRAAAVSGKYRQGETMPKTVKKTAASNTGGNAALLVQAMEGAMNRTLGPLVTAINASTERNKQLSEDMEELKGLHLSSVMAAAAEEEDEEDEYINASSEEEDDMKAGKKNDEDEDDEDEDDDNDDDNDDKGEEDDLEAELEDLEIQDPVYEPGGVNDDEKDKGDKTTVTNPPTSKKAHLPGSISEKRLKSAASKKKLFPGVKAAGTLQAAAVQIGQMQAQIATLKKNYRFVCGELKAAAEKNKKLMQRLRTEIDTLKAQEERYAETVDRRSKAQIEPEIRNLLAKANVDPHAIMAGAAEKLSTETVDRIFAMAEEQGIRIEPQARMGWKNRMVDMGLMENGEERYGR